MSSVSTFNKTNQTDLLSWQTVASGNYVIGSGINVDSKIAAGIEIQLGRANGTAFTVNGPNIRIQGSIQNSGDHQWRDLFVYQPQIGANIANTTSTNNITAGDSTYPVASNTNIAAGDLMFLGHTTDASQYELLRVKSVSGTVITPVYNVVNTHNSGCVITDQAEEIIMCVGLDGITRLRGVADNISGGFQSFYVRVGCTTLDNITNS